MIIKSAYTPIEVNLVPHGQKIRRGDTLWPMPVHRFASIPSPEDAVVEFALYLNDFSGDPLLKLSSARQPVPDFVVTVTEDGQAIAFERPAFNAPAVGKLVWEIDVHVPTVEVHGGVWTSTIFAGSFVVIPDGAGKER